MNDIKYRGYVEDRHYPDNSHDAQRGEFDTPENAFKWAKEYAESFGISHIDYWVEPDRVVLWDFCDMT